MMMQIKLERQREQSLLGTILVRARFGLGMLRGASNGKKLPLFQNRKVEFQPVVQCEKLASDCTH